MSCLPTLDAAAPPQKTFVGGAEVRTENWPCTFVHPVKPLLADGLMTRLSVGSVP
ncbi:MAG: hypothetical protein ACK48N_14635 [Planctomyces sp.]